MVGLEPTTSPSTLLLVLQGKEVPFELEFIVLNVSCKQAWQIMLSIFYIYIYLKKKSIIVIDHNKNKQPQKRGFSLTNIYKGTYKTHFYS